MILNTLLKTSTRRGPVTIQNKVTPRDAKALEPRDFAFAGTAIHRCRGGPLELLKRPPFRG